MKPRPSEMYPEFLESSTNIYEYPGFRRAFQLLDVVFFYNSGKLYHYTGVTGGWVLYDIVVLEESNVDVHIRDFVKSVG